MKRIVLFIFLLKVLILQAQEIECLTDFEFLVKKIKDDYPGYAQKVSNENITKLLDLEKTIRNRIVKYPDSCIYYLNNYTDFFKDKHLRVKKVSGNAIVEKMQNLSDYGENYLVNYDSLKKTTMNTNGLEGIWEDFSDKIAIIRISDGNYVGIAINVYGRVKGQIMLKFIEDSVNWFKVIEYSNIKGHGTSDYIASLHLDGKVLEIHGYSKYVRETESMAYNHALLSSYIPLYPNGINTYIVALSLSDSTFYIRLPSFNNAGIETIVKKYWKEITIRPNLIIDIRNNGGGLDNYYQVILDLLYTKPYERKGVEWYASVGNIKLFEDALRKKEIRNGEDGIKWTQELLTTMKSSKGKFVIHPLMGSDKTITRDTVYPLPCKVGVIINENNASSAEQFLLSAKNSDKVMLFGNKNTAGVLDYSNAVQVSFPSKNYTLLYPMTRSRRLPDYPIDNVGIAPDVIIPLKETVQLYDRIDDWVYFVQNYLEFLK
ncbi:hypothetical protein CYCD_30010 [Tenuifilaceae bacterium CYCD]|nr:hypothetical protein CYCD_30010 [Tenuifilaceae bacterium CYCD]